nr:protein QUIRKY [Ipomoea batatas]
MAAEKIRCRKLIVEIYNAKNLMPKDGQGTASAYLLVGFDGHRRRTTTKFWDLNLQWDERLEFLVHDSESMASKMLEQVEAGEDRGAYGGETAEKGGRGESTGCGWG